MLHKFHKYCKELERGTKNQPYDKELGDLISANKLYLTRFLDNLRGKNKVERLAALDYYNETSPQIIEVAANYCKANPDNLECQEILSTMILNMTRFAEKVKSIN